MTFKNNLQATLGKQRTFFESGSTRPASFRIEQLKKLKSTMQSMESELLAALKTDLNKSDFEAYTSEIGFVYEEINHAIKHSRCWLKPTKVRTPLLHFPSRSYVYQEPKGVVLIIGPWNYPLQLILSPLVGAIIAGNCAVIKPSEVASATEAVVKKLLSKAFSEEFCSVITGGVDETKILLEQKFDHIFFTGSTAVGKIVATAAASTLTPVTLELGGKSPCIVDEKVNISVTARRIVWGKFYNAGQTCVAPDYVLVHRNIKSAFIQALQTSIREFFGSNPAESPDYGRIINAGHFRRIKDLLADGTIAEGGTTDAHTGYIAPTLLTNASLESRVMNEEIFGPILPLIEFTTAQSAIDIIKRNSHPLACYVFSENANFVDEIVTKVPFGGGCVNNTLIHLAIPDLPFGGVGTSGIGAYHGKASFELFSHRKSIVKTPFRFDLPLKYPPYKNRLVLIRKLMK